MVGEWPLVRLGDYCQKIGSGATPKGGSSVYLDDGEISLIRSQNVYNDGFTSNGLVFISNDAAVKLKNVVVEENDILLNITGDSVARVCLAPKEFLPARVNQHVAIIRPEPSEFDPRYLRYVLASPSMQALLLTYASAGATRNALTKAMIEGFEVCKPPLGIQISVANQLSALEERIALNRQTNQTLEQMAQALFKSWFVDFDPVIDNALAAGNPIPEPLHKRARQRGWTPDEGARRASAMDGASQPRAEKRQALRQQQTEFGDGKVPQLPADIRNLFPSEFELTEELGWVPKGWGAAKLGSIVTVKRGGSPRPIKDFIVSEGLPWVKISDATASSSRFISKTKEFIREEGLKKTVLLKKGSLILSNSATPGVPKFLDLDACIHDGWLYFPEKQRLGDSYLYQLFLEIREKLVMQGNGSVFTNLKTDILKNHTLVIPGEAIVALFEEHASELHQRVQAISEQVSCLTKMRDTLLPKLISGELQLPDAKQRAAQATGTATP